MNLGSAENDLTAYLPVRSLVPIIEAVRAETASSAETYDRARLGTEIEKVLKNRPLALPDIQQSLSDLAGSLRRLAAKFAIAESSPTKIADQASVYGGVLPAVETEVIKGHVVYDSYFRVCRFDPMPRGMFSRQIGLTLAAAVDELRRCGLSIVHIGDMLAASTLALGTIAANNAAPSSSMSAAVRSSDDALSSTRNPSETAFYRWRNGHHVFALFSIFCRYFLECGLNAVTRQKFDELCGHVNNATVALRGTTAAMWYAADFPRPIYEKEVRPSMETQHTPQGFSGTQNFDYERLKEARDLLHASLVNTLGRRLKRWPKDAGESYLEFKEVELEDMENHILIAAKMVGRGASMFASKDRGGDLPPAPPAVDMLRDMAAVKVQQLQALLAEE